MEEYCYYGMVEKIEDKSVIVRFAGQSTVHRIDQSRFIYGRHREPKVGDKVYLTDGGLYPAKLNRKLDWTKVGF